MFSCWAAPYCAGRVVALPPGERLSRCGPRTQCTAEADAPYSAMTADRTAACCPGPVAAEYQETWGRQHLHGRKQTRENERWDDPSRIPIDRHNVTETRMTNVAGVGMREWGGGEVWAASADIATLIREKKHTHRKRYSSMQLDEFTLVGYTVTQWDKGWVGFPYIWSHTEDESLLSFISGRQHGGSHYIYSGSVSWTQCQRDTCRYVPQRAFLVKTTWTET